MTSHRMCLRVRFWIVAVWIIGSLSWSASDASAAAADASPRVARALFEEDFTWVTAAGAERYVAAAKSAGFTILIPCVWHGRGVSWPSRLAPMEPRWRNADRPLDDPLQHLIELAHREGLEVHPWFTVMLRQNNLWPELSDGPGFKEVEKAFNPHRPELGSRLVALVREVASRYPIDGINLDYVRTMGVCLSAYCAKRYREATNRDLRRDVAEMFRDPAAWRSLADWNASAVTGIVKAISTTVREERPGAIVSVDSHVGRREMDMQGAHVVQWANTGVVDLIYDMSYERTPDVGDLMKRRALLRRPETMTLLVSNYDRSVLDKTRVWPRDPAVVAKLVRLAEDFSRGGAPIGLYSYRFLTEEQTTLLALQ